MDEYYRKLLVGLITLSINLTSNIISVNTTHLSSVFNIPIQNVDVYTSKLMTLRTLLIIFGTIIYGVVSIYNHERDKLMCTISLGLITTVRLILVILLYITNKLALTMYIVLNVEGFFFGLAQLSVIVSFPQYASTIILATHLSGLLVVIIQLVFSTCIDKNRLLLFKRQCLFCLLITIVSVGWFVYASYIGNIFNNSNDVSTYKDKYNEIKDKLNDKVSEIKIEVNNLLTDINKIETITNEVKQADYPIKTIKREVGRSYQFIAESSTYYRRNNKDNFLRNINEIQTNLPKLQGVHTNSNNYKQNINSLEYEMESVRELINDLKENMDGFLKEIRKISEEEVDKMKENIKEVVNNSIEKDFHLFNPKLIGAIEYITNLYDLGNKYVSLIDTNGTDEEYYKGIKNNVEKLKNEIMEKVTKDMTKDKTIEYMKNSGNSEIQKLKQAFISLNQNIDNLENKISEIDKNMEELLEKRFKFSFIQFSNTYKQNKTEVVESSLNLKNKVDSLSNELNNVKTIADKIIELENNLHMIYNTVVLIPTYVQKLANGNDSSSYRQIQVKIPRIIKYIDSLKELAELLDDDCYYKHIKNFKPKIKNFITIDIDESINQFLKSINEVDKEKISSLKKEINYNINVMQQHNEKIIDDKSDKLKEKLKSAKSDIDCVISSLVFFSKISTNQYIKSDYQNLNKENPQAKVDQIYRKKGTLTELVRELNGTNGEIKNLSSNIQTLKQIIENLNKTINELQSEIDQAFKQLTNLSNHWYSSSFFYLTMVFVSSLFYCFLYPNILPYALLELEKSYKIVIVTLIVSVIGSGLICFVDNYFDYKEWESYIMFGWVLLVPQLIVFIISLITIHSQSWLKCIINSTSVVLILTFVLIVSYSIFESISYVSISNYVCFKLKYDGTVSNIVTYYFICLLICKFLFSKLSVGYNATRVSLGYVLPELKPNSSITNKLGMCYWFRKILLHTVTETYQDLKPNIRNYI